MIGVFNAATRLIGDHLDCPTPLKVGTRIILAMTVLCASQVRLTSASRPQTPSSPCPPTTGPGGCVWQRGSSGRCLVARARADDLQVRGGGLRVEGLRYPCTYASVSQPPLTRCLAVRARAGVVSTPSRRTPALSTVFNPRSLAPTPPTSFSTSYTSYIPVYTL